MGSLRLNPREFVTLLRTNSVWLGKDLRDIEGLA